MREVGIEPMRPRHLSQVMAIEKKCFAAPWSEGTYFREISENSYATYLVAVVEGVVVGYGGYWLILDECHITNIAVHPHWRRRGVGSCILKALMFSSLEKGAQRATLEVRKSNLGAQDLYKEFGFREAGLRRAYYTDDNEDALIMWQDDLADYFLGEEVKSDQDSCN